MIIYETLNKINGKRYIGKDKHNNPNYLGSGKILNKAIKKYGRENFIKTILEYCDSEDHMAERERHWIKITEAQRLDTYYNIGPGGNGGDNITNNSIRDEFIKKMKIINNQPRINTKHSEQTKQNQRKAAQGRYTLNWFRVKYGHEDGERRYTERNLSLSERKLKGKNNPAWVDISKEQLLNLIKLNKTQNEILNILSISEVCYRNKLELYWGTRSLKEVKRQIL